MLRRTLGFPSRRARARRSWAASSRRADRMKSVVGIGLRAPHLAEIMLDGPTTGFLEIHAENYLAGAPALQIVELLRRDYQLSIHAVGLSLGSVEGLDESHLDRVSALVERL